MISFLLKDITRALDNDIVETFDKELVSRRERIQDAALKRLYEEYERGIIRKRKMLGFCLTLGHKIMPSTAIWFVISYWMAGMFEYYMIDFSLNVTIEIIFTFFYFLALFILNFWYNFEKNRRMN